MSNTMNFKSNPNPNPENVQVDIKQSIADVRKAYSNLDDGAFAKMYNRKYGVPKAMVLKILSEVR